MSLPFLIIIATYQFLNANGFKYYFSTYKSTLKLNTISISTIEPPSNTKIIQDAEAQSILQNLKSVNVKVNPLISTSSMIPTSFAKFEPLTNPDNDQSIPIVLIHGFDSSCLEFRRLAPLLSENRVIYGRINTIS